MGEYAEMMLDGTCCCSCGEFLDSDGDGFAAYCASCKPDEEKVLVPTKQKAPKRRKTVACTHSGCNRRFVDSVAMKNHLRTFHIDKDALREKQEKDKKLNAIRNAAPALLEALEELMELESRGRIMSIGKEWDKARAAIAAARGETK